MLPSTPDHTTTPEKKQDLFEKTSTKKAESRIIAKLLAKAGAIDMANKMASCGDTLIFRKYEDGSRDIAAAIFCKQRLCPTCQWRRSRKAAGELSAAMSALDAERRAERGAPYAWIALSYSPQNIVDIADIGDQIDRLTFSFGRLMRKSAVSSAIRGASRCVEIRRSDGAYNPNWRGSWQVHIHSVLAVDPSYFHSRSYISRAEWGPMLAECLDITYIPQFHVERIDKKPKRLAGATRETVKYITKFEIPFDPNSEVDLYSLHVLAVELRGRHMLQHYGVLRTKIRELFGSQSVESDNADLHDILPTRPDLAYTLVSMRWQMGIGYVPYTLDRRRDALLLSQLLEPAANELTGEIIEPLDISRAMQMDDYAAQPRLGAADLREYSAPAENPFLP